jgi:hypothetical protein
MNDQIDATKSHHRKAKRFFWGLLIGSTTVSLLGNVAHAVLPYIPRIGIHIGAAAVPPIALLAAVHGIALAVRAGASGTVYRWAVTAVAVIGAGAFSVSFLALSDLMRAIGYSPATAWIFPTIIDTAVAVSTLMLVALGDKPARRNRTVTMSASARTETATRQRQRLRHGAKVVAKRVAPSVAAQTSPSDPVHAAQDAVHIEATQVGGEIAPVDADLALQLIASGVTTQPVETVIAVLAANRDGASINAAARGSGINYRTAQRILKAAAERQQHQLAAAS